LAKVPEMRDFYRKFWMKKGAKPVETWFLLCYGKT
jgi:hypothetical protein